MVLVYVLMKKNVDRRSRITDVFCNLLDFLGSQQDLQFNQHKKEGTFSVDNQMDHIPWHQLLTLTQHVFMVQ